LPSHWLFILAQSRKKTEEARPWKLISLESQNQQPEQGRSQAQEKQSKKVDDAFIHISSD
jgi:hypothetical protein